MGIPFPIKIFNRMNNQENKVHLNVPQLLYGLLLPHTAACVWGRGTGKTEGPAAMFIKENVLEMPRANGMIIGPTYTHLLTNTLPPLFYSLEQKYGFKENIHYWVRRFPDEKLKIPKAHRYPRIPEHYIQWFNGSGTFLVSQDRPGTINGVSAQYDLTDEAKLMDYAQLTNDSGKALRGLEKIYGVSSRYLSKLYLTDRPEKKESEWIYDIAKRQNKSQLEKIFWLAIKLIEYQEKFRDCEFSTVQIKLMQEINRHKRLLNEMRKGSVYYSEASTIDNIDALGLNGILNLIKTSKDIFEVNTAILNKRILSVKNGYYGQLAEAKHSYVANNYSHVDSISYNSKAITKDCRWDNDVILNRPLRIALDYNNAINTIATAQPYDTVNEFRLLNVMYVLHPLLLDDAVDKWCTYYQYHQTHEVIYYYDNTAIGKRSDTDVTFADKVIRRLEHNKWTVYKRYVGQASEHHIRYELLNTLFKGGSNSLPVFKYNNDNCSEWAAVAMRTGIVQGAKIKKDKSSEKNAAIPANEATHLTEAVDTLIMSDLIDKFRLMSDYIPMS